MPDMDGETLTRAIKSDERIRHTALLILTSVDRAGDARKFRGLGVGAYLVKPVRSVLLHETVVKLLQDADGLIEDDGVMFVEAAPAAGPAPEALTAPKRLRVLLAEDNEVNQLVIKHMLDPNHYELLIAANGAQAVEIYERDEQGVDLVLMDVSMPEMDGYEATRKIRDFEQRRQRAHTPIICLTAHVLMSDIERSTEAGMDDFLSKPVSQDKLDSVISRWTDPSRTEGRALSA